jgi:hypothetical protein
MTVHCVSLSSFSLRRRDKKRRDKIMECFRVFLNGFQFKITRITLKLFFCTEDLFVHDASKYEDGSYQTKVKEIFIQ